MMKNSQKKYSASESHAFIEEFKIPPKGRGPLSGLRFAVKDIIDVAGYKTGCGNPMWKRIQPTALANAVCVDQLLTLGAECHGKTVTSEFAFNLIGENSFFPTPLNPKTPDRVPGGSSSGSASAVACGLVDFAIGTDTGGSVRIPANNCGIFGMRPSHDVISLAGVMPFSPSFDTIGFFARSFDVLSNVASSLLSLKAGQGEKIEKIIVIDEAMGLADADIRAVIKPILDQFSFSAEDIQTISIYSIDHVNHELKSWWETFVTIQFSEIWSSLGAWIETFDIELSEKGKISFDLAKNCNRTLLPAAMQNRELYYKNLNDFLGPRDLICIPTAPAVAPLKGTIGNDRSKGNYYPRLSTLTSIAGIGCLPQITLPFAELNGIPVGVSLLAAHGNDAFLLKAVEEIISQMPLQTTSMH